MRAFVRDSQKLETAAAGITRVGAVGLLVLLLCSCSMLQEALPSGSGSISGSVLSDDYTLQIEALGGEGSFSTQSAAAEPVVLKAARPGAAYVPGEVLVQYRAAAGDFSALSTGGRNATSELVELAPNERVETALERFSRDPNVLIASPNYYIYPATLPDDPYLPQQWSLPAAGLPVTWHQGTGEEVVVAVIDSGFDLGHEDLNGSFVPGYDFCANSDCSATDADPGHVSPDNWHGTHVAGVVAAVSDNGVGVKGVADSSAVKVLPVKIFNDQGGGANTDVLIKAMRWAAGLPVDGVPANPHPARVINLSLAGDFPSDLLQPTIDEVRAAGALIVVSTGNAGVDRVMSPAAAAGVVAVGAINSSFERSCFSNYGLGPNGPGGVDIVAPGGEADGSVVSCGIGAYEIEGLMSTIPGDAYGSAVGTSMAAPMVSGAAAVILSREPFLSVNELESRILASAYFDPGYMSEAEYGAGVLRADKALGFMGPGDRVLVELTAAGGGEIRQFPLTLGLSAGDARFSFEGIEPGSYDLLAQDPESGSLFTQLNLTLSAGEKLQTNLVLQNNP